MGVESDALARIRGPRIEDLISEAEAAYDEGGYPISVPRSMIPEQSGEVRSPARFLPYQPDYPSFIPRETSRPWSPDPVRTLEKEGTFGSLFVEPVAERMGALVPSAYRLTGALGGGMVGGLPGAVAGAAAVEPVAQMMEADLGIAKPSVKRGALNVAAAGIPAIVRPAKPVARLAVTAVQAGLENIAYDWSAFWLGEGERPTPESMAVSGTVGAGLGGLFGAHEAVMLERASQVRRARREGLPAAILRDHLERGGSGYDLDGDRLAGRPGYSVPAYPERSRVLDRPPTEADIREFIADNKDLLDDPRNNIGTWHDKANNKHWLDVFGVIKDRDQAIELGKRYNQIAIWDNERQVEVPTGGDGSPVENLPPFSERLPPRETRLFEDLRATAAKAREFMGKVAEAYRQSVLSDESGKVDVGLLLGETSPVRPNHPKKKKTLSVSEQHIRANLSRIAADEVMSPKGSSYEDWSAKMLDEYGPVVERHLKPAWKQANTALERRSRSLLKDLPNTKTAVALLKAGRSGEDWYAPMRRELNKAFGEDTDLFLRFVALTSPRANIERNLQSALRLYVQYKAGARTVAPEVVERAKLQRQNSVLASKGVEKLKTIPEAPPSSELQGFRGVLFPDWIEPAIRNEEFGGPKVRNFLNALRGDPDSVVIDVWMMRYLGYKESKNAATGETEMPSMTDLEYALNADFIRTQARELGVTPAAFQERIWRGLKRTWPEARSGDTDEPYHVVVKERHAAGLSLFDDATMNSFNTHEEKIARALDEEFLRSGKIHETAEGLGPSEGAFDWSTGEKLNVEPPKARLVDDEGRRLYTSGLAVGEGAEPSGKFFRLKGKTLADIHARDPEAGKQLFEAMGAKVQRGKDTNPELKIYPLHEAFGTTREEVEARLQAWLAKEGWNYKIFGPGEDGKGWTPPDFKTDSYHNNTVWIYQPADPNGSFRDYAYTLPWRVTHEVAHGQVNAKMTQKYGGIGRRQGALGRTTKAPNGKEVAPLSLADALRAVEWEHETFRRQREILEKDFGIKISDEQFARENQVNMSDAVYRALSGDFSSPGDWGVTPQPLPPAEVLKRAKGLLRTAARDMQLPMRERFVDRSNQRGSTKFDALLPVWAMIQVAKGVNTFAKFVARAVRRFGEAVRPYLPAAWQRGRARALGLASKQATPPPTSTHSRGAKGNFQQAPTKSIVDSERTVRAAERLEQRYGKTGKLMAQMLVDHADVIEEQARGKISDPELQRLADQVKVDLVKVAEGHFPRPGTAVPAEDIKAWSDLMYGLDKRMAAKLRAKEDLEPQGKWSPADEAELVDLTNAFVNGHIVLAGKSAEAGRALRAHQVAKRFRNRDIDAYLSIAKARGLSSDQIAEIYRTHKDPLSRAKAVQTMTKLTLPRLYTHARYYTMLMDPTTWINAGLGNATGTLVRQAGKIPGALVDRVFNRGNRYMLGYEADPRAAGLLEGIRKGWQRGREIMLQGVDPESIAAGIAPPDELAAGRSIPVQIAANLPFRALSAVDAMTVSMASTAELQGFAYVRATKLARDKGLSGKAADEFARKQAAEWIASPPEWLLLHTDRLARQISLQTPLGHFWGSIQNALRKYPALTSFLFPFIAPKVNVVKQAAKMTPLGFVQAARLERGARSPEAARELAKRRGIRMGNVSLMEQGGGAGAFQDSLRREAAIVRGEASVGTAAVVLGLPLLIAAGVGDITGDPPKDRIEAQRLGRERPFNAVRVGNVWVAQRTFGQLEPILRTLGNARQSFEIIQRKKAEEGIDDRWQQIGQAAADSLTGLLRAGPLGDLDNLSRIWDTGDPDTMVARLGEYFKGATIIGEVADKIQRYNDPYVRSVESFGDPLRRAFSPSSLAPRLDPLGEPILKRPLPVVKQVGARPSPLLNEAAKAGVAISAPNERTLKVADQNGVVREQQLSLADRRVLNRALGLANRVALQKVVGDRESWAKMDQEERRRELTYWRDTLRQDVRAAARDALEAGRPLEIRDLIQPLEDAR